MQRSSQAILEMRGGLREEGEAPDLTISPHRSQRFPRLLPIRVAGGKKGFQSRERPNYKVNDQIRLTFGIKNTRSALKCHVIGHHLNHLSRRENSEVKSAWIVRT